MIMAADRNVDANLLILLSTLKKTAPDDDAYIAVEAACNILGQFFSNVQRIADALEIIATKEKRDGV